MDIKKNSSEKNVLLTFACLIIVIAGVRAAESIITPFLLSIFIAIVCSAPLFWMEKKGIPAPGAIFIMIVLIIGVGIGGMKFINTSVNDFSKALPGYQERLQSQSLFIAEWFKDKGFIMPDKDFMEYINPGTAMDMVGTMLGSLGGMLTNSFLILVTVIFILLEASDLPVKLRAAWGDPEVSFGYLDRFIQGVKDYIAIKTATSLATGILISLWLLFLGIDMPFLWGMLAFILNFVPNIGAVIAAVPAILLGFIQFGTTSSLLIAIGYAIVNIVIGSVVETKVMAEGLGLSNLVVFLSLLFWGWILGPVGMFLSVPLTMIVKIALEESDKSRWIAILLGTESSAKAILKKLSEQKITKKPL